MLPLCLHSTMEGQNKCYHYVHTVPWKDKTNVTIMFTQYHGRTIQMLPLCLHSTFVSITFIFRLLFYYYHRYNDYYQYYTSTWKTLIYIMVNLFYENWFLRASKATSEMWDVMRSPFGQNILTIVCLLRICPGDFNIMSQSHT